MFGHHPEPLAGPLNAPAVVAYISGWSNAVAVRGTTGTFLVDTKEGSGTSEMLHCNVVKLNSRGRILSG